MSPMREGNFRQSCTSPSGRRDTKLKKHKDISKELYEFIEMVPYSGPGKRLEGSDCAVAYQIKKENRYVSTILKEKGVPLTVIFPGG